MQTRPSVRTAYSYILIIALAQFTVAGRPKADACPSPHGAYTSVLCDQEFIVGDGAYLLSPSATVKVTMQAPPTGDGHIVTYDATTDPPTPIRVFYSGYNGPARRLMAGAISGPPGWFGFQLYDPTDTFLNLGFWENGTSYVKIHDDGCLWLHYADDSYNSGVCSLG